ncbi:MAG: hypothetical protein FD174_3080 [Geobacteraceae bacterium]|nr:MAG: hypothetical protein FD174_3080 [Geobacteraceae bacterium]
MKGTGKFLRLAAVIFPLALLTAGCMGTGKTPLVATVDVDVTDTADLEYQHVYVTINKIEFHSSPDADSDSAGWQTVDISANPVTVDLAQLANGKMYADTSTNKKALFSGIALPADTYRQVRLYLAPTEDAALAPSAIALGLRYNNQATLDYGTIAPIRIPNSGDGIKVVPESPLVVTAGKNARLVLDFNLMDDMIDVYPNGEVECILKPRLGYFDMDAVGAIKGRVAFGNLHESYMVIKAEQVDSGKSFRVVRRTTIVDETTGAFNLYPLPVFGNATTATYDILLRGRNAQTVIVKNVTVHKGTSLTAGAADLGTIAMNHGSEFEAQILDPFHPSGAWVGFHQTLTTDPVPFEVRTYHLNPYTGKFTNPVQLSSEAIQVYDFSTGSMSGPISDTTTTPASFFAVTEAPLYGRSAGVNVAGVTGTTVTFTPNPLTALPSANKIDIAISMPGSMIGTLTKGYLFITYGGLIIDCYQLDALMAAGGGSHTVLNLPGGTAATPLPGAFYGVSVFGWGVGTFASGGQLQVDLTSRNGAAVITMKQ